MKAILACVIFCSALCAGELEDRASINRVIAALNNPRERPKQFTFDADTRVDFDRLIDLHKRDPMAPWVTIGVHETWTELTVPRIVSGPIRFIMPEVAVVDGASTVRGAVTLKPRVPLLFVLKKAGTEWRISEARVLAED